MGQTDDLPQAESLKPKLQRCPGHFSRISPPPKLFAQQIADLYLVRFWQVLLAIPANEIGLSMRNDKPTIPDYIFVSKID